jgi:hypothetical protein
LVPSQTPEQQSLALLQGAKTVPQAHANPPPSGESVQLREQQSLSDRHASPSAMQAHTAIVPASFGSDIVPVHLE